MSEKTTDVSEENLLLFHYIEKNQTETFFEAVRDRKDLIDIRDQFGNTLLMGVVSASMTNNPKENEVALEKVLGLASWESVIDVQNRFGKTALMKASEQRHGASMVTQLLKAGASIEIRGANHFPAIVCAAWQKATTNVDVLMEFGKDIYLKDEKTKKFWSQILQAAWANNMKVTSGLLTDSVNEWDIREFLAQEQAKRDEAGGVTFATYLDNLAINPKLVSVEANTSREEIGKNTQGRIRVQE